MRRQWPYISSPESSPSVNLEEQRARVPSVWTSCNRSGSRRRQRNQHIRPCLSTERIKCLMRSRRLQVTRIDERGQQWIFVPQDLGLGNETGSFDSQHG